MPKICAGVAALGRGSSVCYYVFRSDKIVESLSVTATQRRKRLQVLRSSISVSIVRVDARSAGGFLCVKRDAACGSVHSSIYHKMITRDALEYTQGFTKKNARFKCEMQEMLFDYGIGGQYGGR